MICYCYDCVENEEGYCSCSSYVTISEKGECEAQCVKTPNRLKKENKNE